MMFLMSDALIMPCSSFYHTVNYTPCRGSDWRGSICLVEKYLTLSTESYAKLSFDSIATSACCHESHFVSSGGNWRQEKNQLAGKKLRYLPSKLVKKSAGRLKCIRYLPAAQNFLFRALIFHMYLFIYLSDAQ